jgi:DNA repair protein RadD
MSVFTDTEVEISHLRDCQRGAAVKARTHYSQPGAQRQTLIQLPTGTGKSALIAVLPFYVSCERVLVLVPNLGLVKQMKEDLDVIDFPHTNAYKKFGLLTDEQIETTDFYVMPLDHKVNRTDIEQHHVIVANYQKFQDVEKWFGVNKDLIDLIIIDEAHHQAAKTYQELIGFFDQAKIIGLTATPFRSDGKSVAGKNIYTYHFSDAVKRGYIRNIRVNNVSPSKVSLLFTDSGNSEVYTLAQIVEMKEQAWFSRGIALSQDCCDSIADLAVEKLNELRAKYPATNHQIIASAISIRHAREFIKLAFERHGLRIGMVNSSDEDKATNDQVKENLKQGKLDVVISVGMLGEGFNQPTLGVAAIFRPYKTLNPYIQFVGRVLRDNPPAKWCYVVSHLGLNQVRRFEEFKLFDADDKDFMRKLFEEQGDAGAEAVFVEGGDEDGDPQTDEAFVIKQSSELMDIGGTFVDEDRLHDLITRYNQINESERAKFLKSLGLDGGTVDAIKPKKIKPIQQRLAKKSSLNEHSKSVTTDVIKALGVKHKGRDFNKRYENFGWVQRRVSSTINARLGIKGRQRNDLTTQELEALEQSNILKEVKAEMITYFTAKLEEQRAAAAKEG